MAIEDTGWVSPGNASNINSPNGFTINTPSIAWTNPGNIIANDSNFAECRVASGGGVGNPDYARVLRAFDFGLDSLLPAICIIRGIQVRWRVWKSEGSCQLFSANSSGVLQAFHLSVNDGSGLETKGDEMIAGALTQFMANSAFLSSPTWIETMLSNQDFQHHPIGGPEFTGDYNWTRADLVRTSFGVFIGNIALGNLTTAGNPSNVRVNHVQIKVFYDEAVPKSDTDTLLAAVTEAEDKLRTLRLVTDADALAVALIENEQAIRTFLALTDADLLEVNLGENEIAIRLLFKGDSDVLTVSLEELQRVFRGRGCHVMVVRPDNRTMRVMPDIVTLKIRKE